MLITLQQLKTALQAVKNYIISVIPTNISDLTNDSGFINTETDPTVPSWAKASTKPTYTAAEVGALPDTTVIPSKTSDLTNDSGFINDVSSIDLTDRIIKGTDAQGNDVEGAVVEGLLRNYSYMGITFNKNVSSAMGSHAEGGGTSATGLGAHAEGGGTSATNIGSHSEGAFTVSSNMGAHAEGEYTTASGEASHSEGYKSKASAFVSHAEGEESIASGRASHSEGEITVAMGRSSHAEGGGVLSYGGASHTEGLGLTGNIYLTTYDQTTNRYKVNGSSYKLQVGTVMHDKDNTIFSDITNIEQIGSDTIIATREPLSSDSIDNIKYYFYSGCAIGEASHVEGNATIAASDYQHVQGKYNISDPNNTYAHIVGGGELGTPANIHTLDWDGNGWYAGKLAVGVGPTNDMEVATKQYVDNQTGNKISSTSVVAIWTGTQAQYEALTPDANTLYFIQEV